ncbi:MAG TPA: hypothetical protein VHQ65_15065 [Thermoanaerobaculia bacterium]|nr:hypothetical protein [Thermoanaerobaculia bacterium]
MSLAEHEIAHLVFSTAAANPQSGTEMGREIIATSRGLPEGAAQAMAELADMTGPALRRAELPPLWACRRLGEEHWLVVRGVSLGTYRGGTHRLLTQGLVLARHQVDLLDGNPLLLGAPEARAAGLELLDHHPEGRRDLPPLTLDPAFEGTARRLNRERFRRGGERFAALDAAFPALYDSVRDTTRPTACIPGDSPEPGFVEWLLLHFHPADRAELSFHTWYAYEKKVRFDLLAAPPESVADLRRQMRELDVWPLETSGAGGALALRVAALRRRDPSLHEQVLEQYYLNLLPSGFHRDLRRRPIEPLAEEQAVLCLRAALGEELTADEREAVRRLERRGTTPVMRYSAELADAWEEGVERFAARLERYRRTPPDIEADDLDRLHPPASPTQRLALLAFLGVLAPLADPQRRRQLWPRVVHEGDLEEVLALLATPDAAAVGERVLAPWIDAVAAGEIRIRQAVAWPAWLGWLAAAGRPVAPAAARLEQHIERQVETGAPDAALAAYRRLAKVCLDAGLDAFALRLLFQREVPRLPPAAAAVRVGDGVRWLLAGDGAADAFLAPYLAAPHTAAAAFSVLEEPLAAAGSAPEGIWRRLRSLLAAQPRPALSHQGAGAAGAFLGRVAVSPLTEHTADAFDLLAALAPADDAAHIRESLLVAAATRVAAVVEGERPPRHALARGVGGLLAARNALSAGLGSGAHRAIDRDAEPSAEPGEAVDRALLDLVPPALVLTAPHGPGAGMRGQFTLYLDHLLRLDRLPRLIAAASPWRHLLLDELLASPSPAPEDDPRLRLGLLLAWRCWSEQRPAAGGARPADLAVLRLAREARAAALELLPEVVPSPLRGEAEGLLRDSLLGAT